MRIDSVTCIGICPRASWLDRLVDHWVCR